MMGSSFPLGFSPVGSVLFWFWDDLGHVNRQLRG